MNTAMYYQYMNTVRVPPLVHVWHKHANCICKLHSCSMAKGGQGPSPGGRQTTSLVPRLSHCPVFDRLQYGKMEGEGPFYNVSDVSVYLG